MSTSRRSTFLIGGMIILAVPFVAGLLRKNAIVLPRVAMIGLVIAAGVMALVGLLIMLRGNRSTKSNYDG